MAWLMVTLCALCAATHALGAQASVTVFPGDVAYRDIDRLAAAGLIDTMLVGQRPYTRATFARVVAAARRGADAAGARPLTPALRESLEALEARFHDDLAAARGATPHRTYGVEQAILTLSQSGSTPRRVPADTGIGGIDAFIDPLAQSGQQGRDVMSGATAAIEAAGWMLVGTRFALEARPRIRASRAPATAREAAVSLQALAARFQWSNVTLSVGRDFLRWGQGRHGGLFFSDNAPALDLISIASNRAFVPPGPLRRLGPSAVTFFAADLGARQFFPHTKLFGYKWSSLPRPNLELGVSVFDFTGGRGSPDATVLKRVENLFLFPLFPLKGFQFSNLMAGLEVRYRPAGRNGAELYWELNLDDFDPFRLDGVAWRDDAAHLLGLHIPNLTDDGRLGITAEFHHTGTRLGRHQQFQSGATKDQFVLGDPLGPDADGGYAFIDWLPRRGTTVTLTLAAEAYRANQYFIPTEDPFVIMRWQSAPQERRARAVVALHRQPSTFGVSFEVEGGVERVTRFGFANIPPRTSAMLSASLRYLFR